MKTEEWKTNFTEEMTFENYGPYWHVDHVIPCSKFDLSNDENIGNCFTNFIFFCIIYFYFHKFGNHPLII